MKRPKQKNMMHIGNILNGSIGSLRTGADGDMAKIWALWRYTVGDAIAENTRPAGFKGSLLLVNVSNSAWLQHLTFLKTDLISKLNLALNREMVKELKFKIGNINPPEKRKYKL